MSEFQQKDMSGALFKNAKKEKENQPDYTGECVIDGVKHRISAWLKTSKGGSKYMSLAFSLAQETYKDGIRRAPKGDEDESTPF